MKKPILTLCSLGVLAATGLTLQGLAAQQDDIERAAREMNIMSHIFQTSLQEEGDNNARFVFRQQPEARYLAGQGMVFTFNLAGMRNVLGRNAYNNQGWEEFGAAMGKMAEDVMAQITTSFPDMDFDFDYDYDFDSNNPVVITAPQMAPMSPVFIDMGSSQREVINQMNEAMREQQQEIQEIQRSIREVQRSLRRENGSTIDLENQLKELEASLQPEVAALEDQQKAYTDFMEEFQNQARAQQETLNTQTTGRIIQALCEYGSTLKSLKSDEHITLVFENYNDEQDQIHVFPFEAVSECTTVEKLQQVAVSYLM